MKRTLTFLAVALALVGCIKYELNTDFAAPDELVSPSTEIALDVTSEKTVTLSWKGGGAADGGIVLYNVIFDKEGGDFSAPVDTLPSDLGAGTELTLSHSQLNILARKAGIKAGKKGNLIWTVTASRGGVVKKVDMTATIKLQRGEGIDNIPEQLFIKGSAAKEAGQEFRKESDGLFIIVTKLGDGAMKFSSAKDDSGFNFYAAETGKLTEGGGETTVSAPSTGLARITVNFNTLAVTIEEIEQEVRCIWGANYVDIAILEYIGNGDFEGDGDCVFLGPGREGTPDWCTWVEERYYFIAKVDGVEKCWGSTFGDGSWTPDGTDEFWYVVENDWDQWKNLWKMDHACDLKHVTYTIHTNKDNKWTHSYVSGEIHYDPPTSTPETLFLGGDVAETNDQQMRKEGDKFVIYNKFAAAGNVTLTDGNGQRYFADADGKLFVGKRNTAVEISEGVTRMTVDFSNNTVKFEKINDKVWVENAWDHIVMAELSYQGLGKWAGEGQIKFASSGDERYSLRTTVDGVNVRWGSNKGNDGTAPDGTEEFWYVYESEWDGHQWDNLYKFFKEDQDKETTFGVDANNLVHMRHSVTVKSGDPVPPTVAPEDLALYGTGAEAEGQAFRKVSNGVFVTYSRLKEGSLFFKSGNKNYFLDAEKGLLEGEGEGTSKVYDDGSIARITVDFTTCTVNFEAIGEYAHLKFAADYRDLAHLQYKGNGVWKAENFKVDFIDPNKPETNPPIWLEWVEERYYFIISVDGVEKCWGMQTGAVHNDLKYNGDESFWGVEEFTWSQWDHCWKFDGSVNGANIDVEINTNDNGVWKHTITKK